MHGLIYPQEYGLKFIRTAAYDVITEAHICHTIRNEFGEQYIKNSSLFKFGQTEKQNTFTCIEEAFRSFLNDREIDNVLEIGTGYGTSALLLAHYAYHLTTIDLMPRTEPIPLWAAFGVHPKITYVALNNRNTDAGKLKQKADFINNLKFDFAYIDGDKRYLGIKFDFNLVKRCGRVLFSCYGYKTHGGVKKFIDELPKEEIVIREKFVYWEKR